MGTSSSRQLTNERSLGEGTFGKVYKVTEGDQSFALKIFNFNTTGDKKEAELLKSLDHINIVKVDAVGFVTQPTDSHFSLWGSPQSFSKLCILLEFCDSDLKTKLDKKASVDTDWSLNMAKQMLTGLIYMHGKGVMHR